MLESIWPRSTKVWTCSVMFWATVLPSQASVSCSSSVGNENHTGPDRKLPTSSMPDADAITGLVPSGSAAQRWLNSSVAFKNATTASGCSSPKLVGIETMS